MFPGRNLLLFFTASLAVGLAMAQHDSPATEGPSPFSPVPPAASDSLRFDARLPEFEAPDINGRIWRSKDLQGKLTVVYIWHTFEARMTDSASPLARQSIRGLPELPEVQRFYDEAKASENVQLLTFCRDYDYTHAPEYMKERGYTFPVIADWVLIKKLFEGSGSSGRQWVVNQNGQLSYPFRAWSFGRLLFEVERAARL